MHKGGQDRRGIEMSCKISAATPKTLNRTSRRKEQTSWQGKLLLNSVLAFVLVSVSPLERNLSLLFLPALLDIAFPFENV